MQANDSIVVKSSDFTILPSQNVVPMKLPSNVDSTTLAFGRGSTFKKRKTETSSGGVSGAFERAMATEEAILARRKATDIKPGSLNSPRRSREKLPPSLQRELERHWNEESRDVLGTFQAMRQELLQRKRDAGLLGVDIVLHKEYSYYDLVGSAQLASVELELADVLASIQDGKDRASSLIAKDRQERTENGANDAIANAERQTSRRKLAQSERADIISETVQDAAIMRELARIIRGRALELSESRKAGYRL